MCKMSYCGKLEKGMECVCVKWRGDCQMEGGKNRMREE